MSFSRQVKLEILENKPLRKHYRDALAYGLFAHGQQFGSKGISLRTQILEIADLFSWMVGHIVGKDVLVKTSQSRGNVRVWIPDKEDRMELLAYFEGLPTLLDRPEAVHAFMAGAFLSCGNLSEPKKSYHLEFVAPSEEGGRQLIELLGPHLPSLKTTIRREKPVIYCKGCGQIQDALTMMGASGATLYVIEVEMFKNIRNHANRVTNCETANIDKTVDAATMQMEDMRLVMAVKGEKGLSTIQLETIKLRVENPYASLRELAEISTTPISRSGLNHRLTALSKLAEEIRAKGEERAYV